MATFSEKFQDFLLDQGVRSVHSYFSKEDDEVRMKAQGSVLDQEQRREGEMIADEFFNNADAIEISGRVFREVNCVNVVGVKHGISRSPQKIAMYARSVIAYRLGRMNISRNYDVSTAFVATTAISQDADECGLTVGDAVDKYQVTVKLGIF